MGRRGGWPKGQTGNPAGRPKTPQEVKDALRLRLPERIKRMEALAESKDARVALDATKYLIDRTLGRIPLENEVGGALQVRVEYVDGDAWRPNSYKPAAEPLPATGLPEPRALPVVSEVAENELPRVEHPAAQPTSPASKPAITLTPKEAEEQYGLRQDRPGYFTR